LSAIPFRKFEPDKSVVGTAAENVPETVKFVVTTDCETSDGVVTPFVLMTVETPLFVTVIVAGALFVTMPGGMPLVFGGMVFRNPNELTMLVTSVADGHHAEAMSGIKRNKAMTGSFFITIVRGFDSKRKRAQRR
jgi:hypothetical protein